MKNIKAGLTIEEELFLHCISCSMRETAFLEPLRVKHTSVLVGPHNGHLGREGKKTWLQLFSERETVFQKRLSLKPKEAVLSVIQLRKTYSTYKKTKQTVFVIKHKLICLFDTCDGR